MKNIDFNDFSFEKYHISNVSVIRQKNSWSFMSTKNGRLYNGFLVIVDGTCTYKWAANEEFLSAGSIIYLPKGSKHTVTAPEKTLDFYRISFTVFENKTGEEIVFSDCPMVITHRTSADIHEICEKLSRMTFRLSTDFNTMSLLCDLINYCTSALNDNNTVGIDTAINYINHHFTNKISISELADMCFMNQSHLFRLFKKRLGMTPIDYKNYLRVKKAKKLLCDPQCSIGEIADILGFENACYFTRVFKKHLDISPTEYRKQKLAGQTDPNQLKTTK